jgi:hypothetical protein
VEVVWGVDSCGDFVVSSEAVHVPNHVRCHWDCGEVVCTDNCSVVDGVEAACAGAVGDLCDTDGCNCAGAMLWERSRQVT